MVTCRICGQTRNHAYIIVKEEICCTDCAISIIKKADELGLMVVSKNLSKHQAEEAHTMNLLSNNGGS